MWPLTLFFLFAMSPAPQQKASAPGDIPAQTRRQLALQVQRMQQGGLPAEDAGQLCFTVRSYHFRRQDGQAPVLAGVTTCTPANSLRQRQVSPKPNVLYVPMGMHPE